MWIEIICGLVIYKLVRRFFYDDEFSDVETSDSTALFSVAHRLEKLYGGKAYVGLRIPDADTASRQDIDVVLVTKGDVVVISVKNLSGIVTVTSDGSWVCEGGKHHTTETFPDPLAEVKKQASVLESYLEQRDFRTIHAFPSEVITYEDWQQLKPVSKSKISGWVKGAFSTGKEMQESSHQKLNFILGTAPTWDRVELKSSKIVLGEFLEFKGKQEDTLALRNIKRSKVDRVSIQKTSSPSRLQVLYSYRDYRSEGSSGAESKEVTVRSSTEVLFSATRLHKDEEIQAIVACLHFTKCLTMK
ncbi:Nuclease-related domain NERD [Arabidopsis suecica]|uniref:Nuclease-related domain NERD n=1 Tax=Arabidopsis suecica TaxID=45249 RepID=A0A8T1XEW1_ARASU|nr:Nuclease-related domain NERD [Arabidopsis suecica]